MAGFQHSKGRTRFTAWLWSKRGVYLSVLWLNAKGRYLANKCQSSRSLPDIVYNYVNHATPSNFMIAYVSMRGERATCLSGEKEQTKTHFFCACVWFPSHQKRFLRFERMRDPGNKIGCHSPIKSAELLDTILRNDSIPKNTKESLMVALQEKWLNCKFYTWNFNRTGGGPSLRCGPLPIFYRPVYFLASFRIRLVSVYMSAHR